MLIIFKILISLTAVYCYEHNCPPLIKPKLETNKCEYIIPLYDDTNHCVQRFDCLIFAKQPFDLYDEHLVRMPDKIYGGCRWVYGINPRTGNEEQAELCYHDTDACPNLEDLSDPEFGCAYSFYVDDIGCPNADLLCNEAAESLWPSRTPEITVEDSAPQEDLMSKELGDGEDVHVNCCHWALNGECDANPVFMRARCQYSCGTKSCQMEDAFNCEVNLNLEDCDQKELLYAEACVDYALRCPIWGILGECRKNPSFMHTSCCKTCQKPEIRNL